MSGRSPSRSTCAAPTVGSTRPRSAGRRRPLHRANLRGRWGRAKRWEYWGVVSPTHVLGVTVSDLDYAGVHAVYVLEPGPHGDRRRRARPAARGVGLPDTSGAGPVRLRAEGLPIDLDRRMRRRC